MKRILGIDPGSRITGFGIIESDGYRHSYIASGCIQRNDKEFAARLQQIFAAISQLISEHKPNYAAIEQVFMHVNPNSALKLGQARGAAIVAIADNDIPLAEYSAKTIKAAVVGYGSADKKQIQYMVKLMLKIPHNISPDAADALAIALCHANSIARNLK